MGDGNLSRSVSITSDWSLVIHLYGIYVVTCAVTCWYNVLSCLFTGEWHGELHVFKHQEGTGSAPGHLEKLPILSYKVFQAPDGRLASHQ